MIVAAAVGRLRGHCAGKHSRPHVAQIEGWGADFGKADRGQVDLASHAGELARGDLIDVEAGKAFQLAVTFFRSIIDVVVAERADVISGQRAEARSPDDAGMGIDPRGAVAPWQSGAGAETPVKLGEEVAIGMIGASDDPPFNSLFVVDTPKRFGGVGIFEADLRRLDFARTDDVLSTG